MDEASLPPYSAKWAGSVIGVGSSPGKGRRGLLCEWLQNEPDIDVTFLSCDLATGGIWAGLKDLVENLLPRISEERPDLIHRHGYEITTVLPARRADLKVQYVPLTETSPANEKVRNYPLDRAFRILHGIIDFLAAWREKDRRPWVIVCDDFDDAGALVGRFFQELIRRSGKSHGISLVLGIRPENAERVLVSFEPGIERRLLLRSVAAEDQEPSPEVFRKAALELEGSLGSDLVQLEMYLPQLIYSWMKSDMPERALRWKAMAFSIYNHFGFYEDALIYGKDIIPHIDQVCEEDRRFTRWQLVGGIYNAYVCVGLTEKAWEVLKHEALDTLADHADLARAYYIAAMLHTRFMPVKDSALAEKYIEKGLEELQLSDEPEADKHFFKVFLWNGLALIRHRQGHAAEAIELCRQGALYLDEHLSPEEHLLHRSVLMYNIGQVYASLGALEDAITYYSAAMAMDSDYSEYFNERGNLYLRSHRAEEAISDYLQAVKLSPPYHEVWTNLGQAYKLSGRYAEAERAFSRAIDLEPGDTLAFVGRAQAWEHLGSLERAISDYSVALDLDSSQPLVWANRAALLYESGHAEAAAADLDRAIQLAPEIPDLWSNRAIALEAAGRTREAADDLRSYLRLCADAPECAAVLEKLRELENQAGQGRAPRVHGHEIGSAPGG